MEICTIGIDLGKTVFHLVGLNARGEVVVRKKCSRTQLLRFTSNLRSCLIGMEACGGSHFLGRALREQGITIRKGRKYIEASLPGILEDAENKLSGALRGLLRQLQTDIQYLHGQIEECNQLIERIASELESCQRLMAVPGIGPVIATATIAAIGNGAAFKKGRGFAAWLGLVPGEHSTGGKQQLTGTSRRGNKYLRKLFVLRAHTVLLQRTKQSSGLSTWLASLIARKRKQVATVALANKMARMVWAVLFKGEAYRPRWYHNQMQPDDL